MNSNEAPRTLAGTTAEQKPAADVPRGTRFFDTTKLEEFLAVVIGGIAQWALIGGSGAFSGNLPKYWVAPAGTIPSAPFNTISAAIAAAVADGHTAANPTDIFILPGLYNTEPANTIVMHDGIALRGFMNISGSKGLGQLDTVVIAAITFDAACTSATISNLFIQQNTADTIAIDAAPALTSLVITNCFVRQLGAPHVCLSGAPPLSPSIQIVNSHLVNTAPQGGIACVNITTTLGAFSAQDASFLSAIGTDTAISLDTTAVIQITDTDIVGELVNVAGANAWELTRVDQQVSGAAVYVSVAAGAPTFTAVSWGRRGSTAATPYLGTFTLDETEHTADANSETILATMTTTPIRTAVRLTAAPSPGASFTAAQFQAAGDILLLHTNAGVGAVALPPRSEVPGGLRKYVCSALGGANATTITPNAGDTINGVAAPVAGPGTLTAGFVLISDPENATNWLVIVGA